MFYAYNAVHPSNSTVIQEFYQLINQRYIPCDRKQQTYYYVELNSILLKLLLQNKIVPSLDDIHPHLMNIHRVDSELFEYTAPIFYFMSSQTKQEEIFKYYLDRLNSNMPDPSIKALTCVLKANPKHLTPIVFDTVINSLELNWEILRRWEDAMSDFVDINPALVTEETLNKMIAKIFICSDKLQHVHVSLHTIFHAQPQLLTPGVFKRLILQSRNNDFHMLKMAFSLLLSFVIVKPEYFDTVLNELKIQLTNDDPRVRQIAISHMGHMLNIRNISQSMILSLKYQIMLVLKDKDLTVRQLATTSLQNLVWSFPDLLTDEVWSAMVAQLYDHMGVSVVAIIALESLLRKNSVEMPERVIEAVRDKLDDEDTGVRQAAKRFIETTNRTSTEQPDAHTENMTEQQPAPALSWETSLSHLTHQDEKVRLASLNACIKYIINHPDNACMKDISDLENSFEKQFLCFYVNAQQTLNKKVDNRMAFKIT